MTCQEFQNWCYESADCRPSRLAAAPQEITAHWNTCSACQAVWQTEEKVRERIQQVEVPAGNISQVVWAVRKRRREMQRARVLYWSLSAAAVLLLSVLVHWYVQQPYDLARLASTVQQLDSRKGVQSQVFIPPVQPEALRAWLTRQGISADIPAKLRLQYLTAAHIIEIQGRKVAVLELRTEGNLCRVCLLERRYFRDALDEKLREQDNLASRILADSQDSTSLGWMLLQQGSALLFLDDSIPNGA
ncbi:MAG TPA: hypothetical protein PKA06_04740 [Gemmatales bacterium]|nr:hypothetical protein [Gemmatales bacterium]